MIKKFLDGFPTTPAVVLTGIVVVLSTALRYQLSGIHVEWGKAKFGFATWVPTEAWLMFSLGVLAGATGYFGVKRFSDKDYTERKELARLGITPPPSKESTSGEVRD